MRIAVITAASVTFVLAIALAAWQHSFADASNAAIGSAEIATSAPSRDQIIERVRNMKAIAKSISRIDATKITWAQYTAVRPIREQGLPNQPDPASEVWVVAVAGQYVPTHTKGETYAWGVMVFDAATGKWIRTDADNVGSWPAFFDLLPVSR
jgi:hypothetical protein